MISCYLQGGLGNQMFQVAATIAAAENCATDAVFNFEKMCLPTCDIHTRDGGNNYYRSNIFSNLNFSDNIKITKIYHEPQFKYTQIPAEDGLALYGYFQSEKYFSHYKDLIRQTFSVDDNEFLSTPYDEIISTTISVSIHVRRNDYLNLKDYHPGCGPEYYKKAVSMFPNATYIVFSDDIEWCKNNMLFLKNAHFVEDLTDVQSILLMSRCHHNIIANSSFSWWGAWLNNNKEKVVIAPKQWFGPKAPNDTSDLYCTGWKVI